MNTDPEDHSEIEDANAGSSASGARSRSWIGVMFDCCGIYVRVYRNKSGTEYRGRCPQCLRAIRARVGPDGTASRFFSAW